MEGNVDVEAEVAKIKADLEYAQGSLNIVNKKLSNERFVAGHLSKLLLQNKRKKQMLKRQLPEKMQESRKRKKLRSKLRLEQEKQVMKLE